MNKRLFGVILLAVFLAACSSKPMKDSAQPPVADKSPASQPAAPNDGASTQGATDSSMDGKSNLSPLKDPNNILSKRSIYFDFDKDEIKSEYRPLIEAHAKYLLATSDARVTLQGNADESGTREYNLSLVSVVQ
jgi:peptidoglycan-associated lipoprotein